VLKFKKNNSGAKRLSNKLGSIKKATKLLQ